MWERIWRSVDQVNLIRRLPFVGLVCCLITLAMGAWTCLNVYDRTLAETRQRVADLGAVLAEQASHHVRVADMLLRNVQNRARMTGIATPEQFVRDFTDDDGQDFLHVLAETLPASDGVALFGADGVMVSRSHTGPPFSIADRDYFKWLHDHRSDELLFAGPWVSRASGLMSLYAARRLESADGRFLGVAVIGLATQYFSHLYRSLAQTRGIGIGLMRADGALLVRYPPLPDGNASHRHMVKPNSAFFRWVAQGGGTSRMPEFFLDHDAIMSVHWVPDYALVVDVAADLRGVLRTWWMRSFYAIIVTPVLAIALLAVFVGLARGFRAQERHAAALTAHAEALRASEERLDRAQEIAALGSWEHDIETGGNLWSRNLFRIRGIDPSADIGEAAQPAAERTPARHRVTYSAAWPSRLSPGRTRVNATGSLVTWMPSPASVAFVKADAARSAGAGKSSRKCAPRLSLRKSAAAQMARLTSVRFSRLSRSIQVRL